MARPRKPQWHEHSGRWRSKVEGQVVYFPKAIGRHDRPQVGGIPRAAWDYLHQLEHAAEARATAGSDPTVYWLVELYGAWVEAEVAAGRIAQAQFDGLVSRLKLFLAHPGIEGTKARALTADQVSDFFDSLRGRYSAHYIAGVGRSVRALLRWAARPVRGRTPSRLLMANPLEGYEFPRPPGAVRGYVEPDRVRQFFRWAWGRARAGRGLTRKFDRIFLLMTWFQRLTGCRPGEACGLRWADIDWSAGKATIPPERHKTGRKTMKARVIYLTTPVLRLLRALERLPGQHPEYVFTHMRGRGAEKRGFTDPVAGEPWPSGSAASAKVRALRQAAIAAGLPLENTGPTKLVAYSHRHGYISDAVSSGLSHEQTASLVGNTAAVLGQVYAHAIEDADQARAEALRKGRKREAK